MCLIGFIGLVVFLRPGLAVVTQAGVEFTAVLSLPNVGITGVHFCVQLESVLSDTSVAICVLLITRSHPFTFSLCSPNI